MRLQREMPDGNGRGLVRTLSWFDVIPQSSAIHKGNTTLCPAVFLQPKTSTLSLEP